MGVSRLYKAAAPYPHTALIGLDFAQTADVLYTVHLDYPVYKATRSSHTSWVYSEVTFAPTISPPATPSGSAVKPNTVGYMANTYDYVITAVGGTVEQESRPSGVVSLVNDLSLNGNKNVLTMPAKPAGVERYVVYKKMAGSFGYIGQTEDATFTDGTPQIQPVLSDSPPIGYNPFDAANKYPSTATFHDQRLMLGRTRNLPNAIWGSHPADFENLDLSRPQKPDDSLAFALVAERVNAVNQLASMESLIALTSDGIFSINGGQEGDAMTPASIVPRRENSKGGGRLNPIPLDDILFYMPNKGTTIRTLGFKFEIDGYQSNNVTIFSPHFFRGFFIVDWAYIEEPYSAIFVVRDDGALLCFTWEVEQQVWGWTMFEIDGKVLSVASITEGGYDRLYAVIERTIAGKTRRFHERLALPHVDDIAVACHLDCSVTQVYDPPSNEVSGLWHLEGSMVTAYYDGYVAKDLEVAGGKIHLPNEYEATVISVGFPYSGEIETLPLVLNSQSGSEHTNEQNIAKVTIRAVDTRGLTAGITGADLEAIVERTGGEDGLPDTAQRDYEVSPQGSWDRSQTLTIRQDEPLPAHITGLFVEPRVSKK